MANLLGPLILANKSAIAASGNSGALGGGWSAGAIAADNIAGLKFDLMRGAAFMLDVSAAAAAGGDTLDVYVQAALDPYTSGGPTAWDDFVHFTQALGNGGVKRFLADWVADVTPTTPHKAPQDAALAAGTVLQGPIESSILRVRWVVAGASPVFTFAVSMHPQYRRGRS